MIRLISSPFGRWREAASRRVIEGTADPRLSERETPLVQSEESGEDEVAALRSEILSDAEPDARASAVLTLASLGPAARPMLQELFLWERDPQVRRTFQSALGGVR